MDSCDSVGRSKICDVRRCKKRMWLSVKVWPPYSILLCTFLYIASEDPCNHNEAMYFYAHFRRKGGHNEKSVNPEKRLCKRTDKDHPCYKRWAEITESAVRLSWERYRGGNHISDGDWAEASLPCARLWKDRRDIFLFWWCGNVLGGTVFRAGSKSNFLHGCRWCTWRVRWSVRVKEKWDREPSGCGRTERCAETALLWGGWDWKLHDEQLCLYFRGAVRPGSDERTGPPGGGTW